ncbi:hypothetical protein AA0113_g3193 [Alternaria arborescens]|uniref:Mid2 domain-containing protein n=1 Tax=Alternaria arborescens TaxID=156630 RepID=A0A4Q4SIN0_9PLEO|nr:hypothetical protein AA0111_g2204 [Alternaria arborescens]RYO37596.1 hypothetical protein AA0111_g2204 [Alternaria arborescens]RYO70514.1 hypothetical protein AA0113_g3193 [Alternaria arborescens]
MATSTDPTVPLPTTTDNDDDDDDDVTSLAPGPPGPPAPTPNASTTSASVTATATSSSPLSSLTGIPTPNSTDASVSSGPDRGPAATSGNSGLSAGASAGIGVGAAVGIILLLLAGWFFVRRRRSGLLRRLSKISAVSGGTTHDLEKSGMGMSPEIIEHGALGPAEMEAGNASERRPSELASPVVPVEAAGDRRFAAELPGSEVPPAGVRKGSKERLFLDSPIDEEEGRFEKDLRPIDEKKPPL